MNEYAIKGTQKEHNGKNYFFPFSVKAENVETDKDHRFVSDDEIKDIEDKLDKKQEEDGSANKNTIEFTQASKRENIKTGETLAIICGKISKFFADVKDAAFRSVTDSVEAGEEEAVTSKKALKDVNEKFGGMYFYEENGNKYVVGADAVPKKLGSSFEIKKLFFYDGEEIPWYSDDITGYSLVKDQFSYNLGTEYEEVIVGIVSASAIIMDFPNKPDTTKNTTSVSYNANTGMIGVDYGQGLYLGGGHCARVVVMYR